MENSKARPTDLPRPRQDGEKEEISLETDKPGRMVKIEVDLGERIKVYQISLLRANVDLFMFSANKNDVINPSVMVHRLNVNEDVRMVKKKKSNFS